MATSQWREVWKSIPCVAVDGRWWNKWAINCTQCTFTCQQRWWGWGVGVGDALFPDIIYVRAETKNVINCIRVDESVCVCVVPSAGWPQHQWIKTDTNRVCGWIVCGYCRTHRNWIKTNDNYYFHLPPSNMRLSKAHSMSMPNAAIAECNKPIQIDHQFITRISIGAIDVPLIRIDTFYRVWLCATVNTQHRKKMFTLSPTGRRTFGQFYLDGPMDRVVMICFFHFDVFVQQKSCIGGWLRLFVFERWWWTRTDNNSERLIWINT